MGKLRTSSDNVRERGLYTRSQQSCLRYQTGSCHKNSDLIKKSRADNDATKDLSIETDFCILRRFFKNKLNRQAAMGMVSQKSSAFVDIEKGNNELKNDYASGDQYNNVKLDLTKVMIENLQDLLNNWIKNYLQNNLDSKNKLKSAFNSLMDKAECDTETLTSTKSMYFYNQDYTCRQVKNVKGESCLKCCRVNKGRKKKKISIKTSCHTMPGVKVSQLPRKHCRIISTLTIPRKLHHTVSKQIKEEESTRTINPYDKRLIIQLSKSQNRYFNVSDFDLLNMSAKSFTRRFATYDFDKKSKRDEKRRHVITLSKSSFRSHDTVEDGEMNSRTDDTSTNLENMPSILRHLYEDPSSIGGTQIFPSPRDDCTMTNLDSPLVKFKTAEDKVVFNNENMKSAQNNTEEHLLTNRYTNNQTSQTPDNTLDFESVGTFIQNFTTKGLDVNRKKAKERIRKTIRKPDRGIKHQTRRRCGDSQTYFNTKNDKENALTLIAGQDCDNKLKLDIAIKIVPMVVEETNTLFSQDKSTIIRDEILHDSEHIVPILDGAASQDRYMKSDSPPKYYETKNTIKPILVNPLDLVGLANQPCPVNSKNGDGIAKYVTELKDIIKQLTAAAETFLNEYLKSKAKESNSTIQVHSTKAVQYVNEIGARPTTGIKLTKEPKLTVTALPKETNKITTVLAVQEPQVPSEFFNRLMKKSTSYNIIQSESILKVTDMTSAANISIKSEKKLRRSKSLIEICSDRNRAYLTFFYKQLQKDKSESGKGKSPQSSKSGCKEHVNAAEGKTDQERRRNDQKCVVSVSGYNESNTELKKTHRFRSIRLWEMFYCAVILIPVFILFYLLYENILKFYINDYYKQKFLSRVVDPYALQPSDFGF